MADRIVSIDAETDGLYKRPELSREMRKRLARLVMHGAARQGITYQTLAKHARTSITTVRKITSQRANPNVATLDAILKALDKRWGDLDEQ